MDAQDGLGGRRLAGAALAHHGRRLPGVEVDAAHGVDGAQGRLEADVDAARAQDGPSHPTAGRSGRAARRPRAGTAA